MKFPLAPEGRLQSLLFLICIIISLLFKIYIVAILCAFACLFTLYFFRDPKRTSNVKKDVILSPADGKVIVVDEAKSPFGDDKMKHIGIFMSALNVHVNRMPIDGKIEKIAYWPGKFIVASRDKSSELNERQAFLINNNGKKFTVVQIAGFVARRIVSYVNENEELSRGDKLGIIQLGSRVDIYLPTSCEVHVEVGDKIKAGITEVGKQ